MVVGAAPRRDTRHPIAMTAVSPPRLKAVRPNLKSGARSAGALWWSSVERSGVRRYNGAPPHTTPDDGRSDIRRAVTSQCCRSLCHGQARPADDDPAREARLRPRWAQVSGRRPRGRSTTAELFPWPATSGCELNCAVLVRVIEHGNRWLVPAIASCMVSGGAPFWLSRSRPRKAVLATAKMGDTVRTQEMGIVPLPALPGMGLTFTACHLDTQESARRTRT